VSGERPDEDYKGNLLQLVEVFKDKEKLKLNSGPSKQAKVKTLTPRKIA
jgi:hypothetical protein